LCAWHVNKDVLAYCKNHFGKEAKRAKISFQETHDYKKRKWEAFYALWKEVLYAATEEVLKVAWDTLRQKYRTEYPEIITYLATIWICVKERCIRVWNDKITHFGNATTQRAEGIHPCIKRDLPSQQGHLNDVVCYLRNYLLLTRRPNQSEY
jgi:hypothetical protein